MIAIVQGAVAALSEGAVVVMVVGVGLQVHVPAQVRAKLRIGEHISLHTHLVVREDLLALYGFELETERDYFILLLGVSGVGPRTGLAILSILTTDAIRRAVLSEQADVFARVPGVGKRNAQKILLHLQGKIKGDGLEAAVGVSDTDESVLEALTTLGYSVVEAQAALQSIPRDTPQDVEERLRIALQFFS